MTPNFLSTGAARAQSESLRQHIRAQQVRLLFGNSNLGIAVTLIAISLLARLQWDVVPHPVILRWSLYMFAASAGRFLLERGYWRTAPSRWNADQWGTAYTIGAGLSGAGWGAAGLLLYPEGHLANQVFLFFVIGGMMLGGVSLLSARQQAFLAFFIPTALTPSTRLFFEGDETHLAMGILADLFSVATLITSHRIHQTIASSLKLQFENHDLVENLRTAKGQADALNEQLEVRVQERTADLQRSAEQLRAEITQREQVEEELLRARKLESLGVLAGGIAHDFNNFLTVIQGNLELAKLRLDPDEPVQEILDQSQAACQRAVFLSSQLLTFAKGGSPVRRLVSLAGLVMDAVQLVRAGAQTSVDVSIDKDLWPAEVDPGQIGQVLHNILLNARQAMPEGGIIEVHAENAVLEGPAEPDRRVRVSILDYGCGITPDILPRIFDPYFTTKAGGSGLGLATSYAIVKKHGGTLSVKSQPGNGTVVTIDLPASRVPPVTQTPVASDGETGTERLLIMDDEEAVRTLLARILAKLGYEVQCARDGAEAIALFESARASGRGFDAVMLDLTVKGGMGGIEAAARLKALDPSVKLVVSSGYSDSPVLSDFRKYGFDDVIPKPWGLAEVGQIFRRVLIANPDRKIE